MTAPKTLTFTPRRGRPRKFLEQSRALTLTLPEPVIAALTRIDPDVSRAIVRLMQPEMRTEAHPPAELASFGRHAVIVVNPTRTLERRTGVLLIPLSDGRALIAFDDDMTPAGLELRIQDELEDQKLPSEDRRIFESIRDLLRTARRAESVAILSPQIMVLEHVGPGKRRKTRSTAHTKETE